MKLASIISLGVAILTAIATAASGDVQAFWAAHAELGPLVLLGWKTVALFMPSPAAAKPEL